MKYEITQQELDGAVSAGMLSGFLFGVVATLLFLFVF